MCTRKVCAVVLLVLGISLRVETAATRAVTHEEIKEALINFMHIVRSNTEKLERHENRERQLGELLKRALSALEKKERAQDLVLDKILESQQSISDRLEKIERGLSDPDFAARGAYTIDSIPGQSMATQIETMIDKRIDSDRLREVESLISSKIDYLSSLMEKLQANLYNANSKLEALAERGGDGGSPGKLDEQLAMSSALVGDLKELKLALGKAQDDGDGDDKMLMAELNGRTNKIELELAELAHVTSSQGKRFEDAVRKSHERVESELGALRGKFDEMTKEANQAIGNVEQVLVKTADDVIDTKRRVEHGIYQIRTEVGDYVKSSQGGNDYNDTVVKFAGMAETLLENQANAVANLSTKVESEISQVWRQIGIMHQQITASGHTLDSLQNQTNHYIKDSENKLDVMSSKLETIESSIDLVQENNNFLVGRFSLFTHEFNETRNLLAQTTKDLNNVLKTGKLGTALSGPGPHDIADSSPDSNTVDNKLDNFQNK